MTGVIVLAAVVLFLAGVAIGVIAAAAVLVRREDRDYGPLTGTAPSRLARYVRYLNG
jgi:hypothetical protein